MLAVLAPTVGPAVGGWITQTYTWHWLFLVNVVPGILAFLIGAAMFAACLCDDRLAAGLDIAGLALLAIALAALEIGLKEAPTRGWLSAYVAGLLAVSAVGGVLFVVRSLRASQPVVELRIPPRAGVRYLAVRSASSCGMGVVRFGLSHAGVSRVCTQSRTARHRADHAGHRHHPVRHVACRGGARAPGRCAVVDARRIPDVRRGSRHERSSRRERRISTPCSGQQVIRGAAIMLCLLPPTRLALGDPAPEQVPDASGLFNLMRNLGGAIGIALIDTVIWGRLPGHADALRDRLMAGDASACNADRPSTRRHRRADGHADRSQHRRDGSPAGGESRHGTVHQ